MTTTETETHTLQVWPSGRGYEYCGEPTGPIGQKTLRARVPTPDGTGKMSWRDGQPDEWREIVVALRAERYQARDVLCCDSGLVDDLLKLAQLGSLGGVADGNLEQAFGDEEIRNRYPDPDGWTIAQCVDWLNDHGHESPDVAEPYDDDDEVITETCREAVQENSEPAEVYEWWRISSWLCDQLHAIGEVTIDNGYGHWWGRQVTGQACIMDGTLQQVAAQFDEAP